MIFSHSNEHINNFTQWVTRHLLSSTWHHTLRHLLDFTDTRPPSTFGECLLGACKILACTCSTVFMTWLTIWDACSDKILVYLLLPVAKPSVWRWSIMLLIFQTFVDLEHIWSVVKRAVDFKRDVKFEVWGHLASRRAQKPHREGIYSLSNFKSQVWFVTSGLFRALDKIVLAPRTVVADPSSTRSPGAPF